ncbi:MAG TPA: hypothetical protein PKN48_00365 [Bacteroidales bacterium]|nr:hypothetical protein [Bacteroidales bacterium]
MSAAFTPFNGIRKVEMFRLDDDNEKLLYEKLLNDPDVTIIKEEFVYGGREHSIPITTIWYEKL